MLATHLPAGARFGRLEVLGPSESVNKKRFVQVRCACGVTKSVRVELLNRGLQSCGCLRSEKSGQRAKALFTTHGEAAARTPEYVAWLSMIRRCTDPNGPKWEHYGGRGIQVCEKWHASFEAFLADVGRRPSRGHSLDRIQVDGNYEPGNVRWATATIQRHNRRDSRVS
jgi:hypothetical protein